MEYRQLGRSGLRVSALTLGTMTFGGRGDFQKVGDDRHGRRPAPGRSAASTPASTSSTRPTSTPSGVSEEIVGEALEGRRDRLLSRRRRAFRSATGRTTRASRASTSCARARTACGGCGSTSSTSTRCTSGTAQTPLEETLEALDTLVRQGKVRYVGCSNFSGWHLMKALAVADRLGCPALREPADPLHAAGARGRVRAHPGAPRPGRRRPRLEPARRRPAVGEVPARRDAPAGSRQLNDWDEPPVRDEEALWRIVDELVAVAEERGVSAAQVALAWLLARPGVASLVIAAHGRRSSSRTTSPPPRSA